MTQKDIVPAQVSNQYCELGRHALYKLYRYEDALFYFTEALRFNRDSEEAYVYKATTLMRLKRYREVVETCDDLLELNQCNFEAYKQKALALPNSSGPSLFGKEKAIEVIDEGLARINRRLRNLSSYDDAEQLRKGIQELTDLRKDLERIFVEEPGILLVRDAQKHEPIKVSLANLQSSTYICGVQGSGKTSILTHTALEMIERGESVIVIDPSGDMCRDIMLRMPKEKVEKTYYLSMKLFKFPFSLNLFSYPDPGSVGFEATNAARNQIYMAFSKIFGEGAEGIFFKGILRNLIPILLDHPSFTIFHIEDFILDAKFRAKVLQEIQNPRVHRFWERFNRLPEIKKQEEAGPFLRRLEELLEDPAVVNHIGQKKGLLNIKKAIEHKEILLIHLPLDDIAYLKAAPIIGTLLMMQIYAATFSFTGKRPGFTLLVDEFSEFLYAAGGEFRKLLELGRKYAVRQVLCHQHTGQFEPEDADSLRDALTSSYVNIVMRTTLHDSIHFAPLFSGLKQYPAEIEIEPLDKLRFHKSSVVKEFWRHIVRPLQEKLEAVKREQFASSHVAVENDALEPYFSLLENLHNLLYYSQKKGEVDQRLRTAFITAYAEFVEAKTKRLVWVDLREEKQRKIEDAKQQIKTSQQYLESSREEYEELRHKSSDEMIKVDMGNYNMWETASQRRMSKAIAAANYRAEIPDLEKRIQNIMNAPNSTWEEIEVTDESVISEMIDAVLSVLLQDPLTAKQSELPPEDIGKLLKGMRQRHGLAKVEGAVYEIETIDLPRITIAEDEIDRRIEDIIMRTKKKYCRGKREIEDEIKQIYDIPFKSTGTVTPSFLDKFVDDKQQHDNLDKYENLADF